MAYTTEPVCRSFLIRQPASNITHQRVKLFLDFQHDEPNASKSNARRTAKQPSRFSPADRQFGTGWSIELDVDARTPTRV